MAFFDVALFPSFKTDAKKAAVTCGGHTPAADGAFSGSSNATFTAIMSTTDPPEFGCDAHPIGTGGDRVGQSPLHLVRLQDSAGTNKRRGEAVATPITFHTNVALQEVSCLR